jgi:two-component system, cell cycle response regulator
LMTLTDVTLSTIIFGPLGAVMIRCMMISILLMSLLVSFRLLVSRRKIGYFSIALALCLVLIQYGQLLGQAFSTESGETGIYIELLLKLLSFAMINIGIYQLYNATRKRDFIIFGLFLSSTIAISMTYWYVPVWLEGSGAQLSLIRTLGPELYLFLLIFLSFMLVNPRIGQNGKFQMMLTIYFAAHMIHVANVYLFGGTQAGLTLLELVVPVFFYIVLFLFIVERVIEIMQAIYNSSITDGLTKLYNRKYFYKRVSQYVLQKIPVSVLFSDIDNFKKLNDTKGHAMGDQVLKQVAQIIREEAEEIGVCGRYGGEEMVVLVTDVEVDAGELAERIRARVESETIVTVSMGLAAYHKGVSTEQLIKEADEAMYQAKTTGKNKVILFSA